MIFHHSQFTRGKHDQRPYTSIRLGCVACSYGARAMGNGTNRGRH